MSKKLKQNPSMSERIRKGEVRYHSCNGILVERWKDKKEVRMISTGMPPEMKRTVNKAGTEKEKPATILQTSGATIISTVGEHSTTKGRKATVSLESSKRLTERHFPVQVPVTGKTKYPTKECAVCRKKNGKGKTGDLRHAICAQNVMWACVLMAVFARIIRIH
ncbi:PiggyBac transposable element-derived protein 4 [Orchesella cincta]|uniref:PiggyBac transposable element-derived protein 4 n=1 Tax=Orchesella cincta TaxID=48709 RepID=A0A1D2M5M9_ORCCI|nr:PiggyBac transposable element-derived protein 4 [Orchesella cincta]